MKLRIVSGGQTGADRAALDAAQERGLETGGWCPRGRRAEDGRIPGRYPLRETPSAAVEQRTEWNVRDSDATLILVLDAMDRGTSYAEEQARAYGKPLRIVDLTRPTGADDGGGAMGAPEKTVEEVTATRRWLEARDVSVLNVAGPRESNAPGLYAAGRWFLEQLFERLETI
jgi:hypothetical protein